MSLSSAAEECFHCEFCTGASKPIYNVRLGKRESRLFKCPSCETAQVNPVFSEKSIKEFYENSYFSREPWQVRKAKLLARDYMRLVESDVPRGDGVKALEIGASYGYFANLFGRKLGSDVDIIEPSRDCIEFVKDNWSNVRWLGADLSAAGDSPKYDAIFLFHVAEHLQRLGPFLRQASRLLKAKGRIFILTPNGSSASFKLYAENWIWAGPSEHYQFLSSKMPEVWFEQHALRLVQSKDRVPHWIHFPSRCLSQIYKFVAFWVEKPAGKNKVGRWLLNQIRRVGLLLFAGNRFAYGLLPLEAFIAGFKKGPQDELYLVLEKDCADEAESGSHHHSKP